MDAGKPSFEGSCVCSAVAFEATSDSVLFNNYCHCHYCRQAHASDFVHLIGFAANFFRVTKGKDVLKNFKNTPNTDRYFCGVCGTRIYTHSTQLNVIATFPALVTRSSEDLRPLCHVNYASRVFDVYDNLPKYRDIAKAFGGSGALLDTAGQHIGFDEEEEAS